METAEPDGQHVLCLCSQPSVGIRRFETVVRSLTWRRTKNRTTHLRSTVVHTPSKITATTSLWSVPAAPDCVQWLAAAKPGCAQPASPRFFRPAHTPWPRKAVSPLL